MKRTLIALLFLLYGGSARSAPIAGAAIPAIQGSSPQKTITSISLNYERNSQGVWIAHIANMSHKDVTTVEIGVSLEPNGPVVLDLGEGGTFAPGATKTVTIGLADQDKIYPAVDIVIYADNTAEVTNENAWNRIIKGHKESLLALQKANEIIKANVSNPSAAAAALEALAKTVPKIRQDETLYPNPRTLQVMADEIRNGKSPADLLSRNQEAIANYTPVKKVPGGVL